jgi:hypothetical protein
MRNSGKKAVRKPEPVPGASPSTAQQRRREQRPPPLVTDIMDPSERSPKQENL